MYIKIESRYYSFLRENLGRHRDSITLPEGATIMDFLAAFLELYGDRISRHILDEQGQLRGSMAIAVNGEKIEREKFASYKLRDGDVVVIIPPISGGLSY